MATVDLVCSYDPVLAWIAGSNISAEDGATAYLAANSGVYANLYFTTDVATALPAGAVISEAQLIIKLRTAASAAAALVYVKNPGGFVDGGAASHTINFNTATLTKFTSTGMAAERPAVLVADNWLTGQLRMIQSSGSSRTFHVDYLSIRLTYTVPSAAPAPTLFMSENF